MGLRKFSLRAFLKKNLDFIAGVSSEIGLCIGIIIIALAISFFLVFIKSLA